MFGCKILIRVPVAQSVKAGEDARGRAVKKLIDYSGIDIVRANYVMDCASQRTLLPMEPRYLIHPSAKTRLALSRAFDKFGDSYTELLPDSVEGKAALAKILQKVDARPGFEGQDTQAVLDGLLVWPI